MWQEKNTSVFRTCKRPFYSCLLSSLAYHVPHILYTRTAHAPRHSAIVPRQHLCRSQRFNPFGRWSKGSNLRERECGNTWARKKGVINAVGIWSCSFSKLAIKKSQSDQFENMVTKYKRIKLTAKTVDEGPASLNVGSLEKRSNQPKYKEPKRRSPKTTAKLIQNNVYCFFHDNISAGHASLLHRCYWTYVRITISISDKHPHPFHMRSPSPGLHVTQFVRPESRIW